MMRLDMTMMPPDMTMMSLAVMSRHYNDAPRHHSRRYPSSCHEITMMSRHRNDAARHDNDAARHHNDVTRCDVKTLQWCV